MSEAVRFHFDPLCPWCYQTSRWARRLQELDVLTLDWGVFSLEIVNAAEDSTATGPDRAPKSGPALRTFVAIRDQIGNAEAGAYYAALGKRIHQQAEPAEERATVESALTDAGLDVGLYQKAIDDDATWTSVESEHTDLVTNTRSFGVPAIVLDGGDGPAIFGPVISNPATDDDAVALWEHVSWLARYDNFSELKRDRIIDPDLETFRRYRAHQAQKAAADKASSDS